MQTFQQFLASEATQGGVNLLFESAMYSLVDELERIARILTDAKVAFEVIGGMAVNAHLLASQQRSRTFALPAWVLAVLSCRMVESVRNLEKE